ncbi:DNA (cytosine-5-)-methyltransferase [Nibricoccus aquaticus]|uniref:DNA (cytosine-5-)-methyltransferase n=1 Tax=Nibricoccus aquaticus TaxID=2576891 RepID=A0A290Q9W1_9BACT|nr:DNA cytosine methyltransferase [Nibricoccus aquaticus]ATC65475.1 DNA (cytosine-5-)-methyltransferase [Nibricoccus aquaticus]
MKRRHVLERGIQAVDLFCGAGGLTCGLKKAGVKVRLGVDVDPACQYPYEYNNSAPCLLKDVREIKTAELASHFVADESIRLIAGCAPCQTFSTYNQKADKTDSRWWLLREFLRVVRELNPELVTMENVPGLAEHTVFGEFLGFLHESGYHTAEKIVRCEDYGIPQQRSRLVVMASRLGKIDLLPPSHFRNRTKTVRDALSDLPVLASGGVDKSDPIHQSSELSPLNLKRIRASKPSGTWRDWPNELVAKCHRKKSGKTYPSVYGRMSWDEPAPTITTQFFGFGNGRFGHPEQDRAISLREGAIIQSFPRTYRFVEPNQPIYMKAIGRLVGNAVPVRLGEVIGKSFRHHIDSLQAAPIPTKR